MSSKRAFGTDITNIDNKRGKLVSETENKPKLMQGGSSMLKTFESQLGQGKSSGFVYGPFHPAGARKHEIDDQTVRENETKNIQDWESLSVSFRPQYQNHGKLNIPPTCLLSIVKIYDLENCTGWNFVLRCQFWYLPFSLHWMH